MNRVLSIVLTLVLCLSFTACSGTYSEDNLAEILCTGAWESTDNICYIESIDRKVMYTYVCFDEDGTCTFFTEDYRDGELTETDTYTRYWKINKGEIAIFPETVDSDEEVTCWKYIDGKLIGSAWYCDEFTYTHISAEEMEFVEVTVPPTTEPVVYSRGLEYMENGDGTCTVIGIGTCGDTDIVIPTYINDSKVTGIGECAFLDCSNLKSVIIPEGVTSIGSNAFCNCHNLNSIIIPHTVTSIGEAAFYCCCSMAELTIGNSVTNIEAGAFSNCSGLISVTIPDSVTHIGSMAFQKCRNLTSLTIGSGVIDMGTYAFAYCDNLTNLTIKDGVACIGEDAFSCSNITCVTIPDSVTSIGERAFSYCSNLSEVTIGNGTTAIVRGVFASCSNLKNVKIPDSVTSLGAASFYSCSSLTQIDYSGTMEQWSAITKDDSWNKDSGSCIVCCADGEVSE